MKIVCESCQAKYSISDDKVRGKAFKIRCKKCSHIIVVRSADAGNLSPGPEPVSGAIATPENSWHIVVDGEQVGPLSASDIRARLARGEISGETYIWREGLADWLKVSGVSEFAEGAAEDEVGSHFQGQAATTVYPPGTAESAFAASPGGGEPDVFSAATTISASGAHPDLFASPMASESAPSNSPFSYGSNGAGQESPARGGYGNGASAAASGGSMTGQRHENSVLFSLSNLEALAAPSAAGSVAPRPGVGSSASSEGSGLIDIRSMAAMTLGSSQAENRPSNDLPTFGAPQFSPVSPVLLPIGNSSGSPKWVLPFIAVLVLFALVLGIATVKMWTRPAPAPVAVTAPPPEVVTAPVAPAPVAVLKPAAPPTTPQPALNEALPPREPRVAASERTSSSRSSHSSRAGHEKKGRSESGGSEKSSAVAAAPVARAEPAETKPSAGKGDKLDDLLSAALGSKPRSSGGGSRARDDDEPSPKRAAAPAAASLAPLEKSDIVKAMMGVNGKVRDCYNQYKVPGTAMVGLKVARGGKVTDASVSGKFAGTPTGTCVESAVKTAKFPPCEAQSLQYPFSLH